MLSERQANTEDNSYVQLTQKDTAEALRRCFDALSINSLIRSSWANDGVMPFDRRIAFQLFVQEEEAKDIDREHIFSDNQVALGRNLPTLKVGGVIESFLIPNPSIKAKKSLEKAIQKFSGLDDIEDKFKEMQRGENVNDDEAMTLLGTALEELKKIKEGLLGFLDTTARAPRPPDLWDLKGGANGEQAMMLLNRSVTAASGQGQGQGQRGRPVANLDERVASAHDAFNGILNDLRRHKQLERLSRDQLVTCFLHIFERPPHVGMKKNAMVEALKPEFETSYPEYMFENESESEDVVETQGEEDDVDDGREIDLNLLFPSSRAQPIQEPSP